MKYLGDALLKCISLQKKKKKKKLFIIIICLKKPPGRCFPEVCIHIFIMARQGRGLFVEFFKDFVNSLRPKHVQKGNHMGTDYMGTKYFEIPADPQGGVRRSVRSFEPIVKDKFDQIVPPEWEAWLRGRRKQPPTEDEINRNLGMIKLKEKNAAELSLKFPSKSDTSFQKKTGMESFPSYNEYEQVPGTKDENDKPYK
uniref:NADH dehydrogenase [ubiquinone] 1 alpha subcomplex assembly factor 2 n=2 Tax=Cacopsylla melanoneura TaxID=428564 RepID=A0A8D8LRE2_9HEMI